MIFVGLDKERKKDFRMFSCGYDNKTYYIGRSNNRIKIYNKKLESNLDYDLTRVEITSKIAKGERRKASLLDFSAQPHPKLSPNTHSIALQQI